MIIRSIMTSVLATAQFFSAGLVWAADPILTQERVQAQNQEQIYGSQLMTQQERAEFSAKKRAAKTAEEREKIRMEHHERMKERAEARGTTLPDESPTRRGGMGFGSNRSGGGGMGSGGRGR